MSNPKTPTDPPNFREVECCASCLNYHFDSVNLKWICDKYQKEVMPFHLCDNYNDKEKP
jgi:hypothetical protein